MDENVKTPQPARMEPPTVGRRLWYWPTAEEVHAKGMRRLDSTQPFDAGVLYVHPDGLFVNLMVTDHIGNLWPTTDVQLVDEGDIHPDCGFAAWMPYQRKKAQEEDLVQAINREFSFMTQKMQAPAVDLRLADPGATPEAKAAQANENGAAMAQSQTAPPGTGLADAAKDGAP